MEQDRAVAHRLDYRNPRRPRLGVEALTLAEIRSRVSMATFRAPQRLAFHQIILITSGTGKAQFDFIGYPCAVGTLFHARPGQVSKLPDGDDPALDGRVILFTEEFLPSLATASDLINDRYGQVNWLLDPTTHHEIDRAIALFDETYRTASDSVRHAERLAHHLAAVILRIADLPRPDREKILTSGGETYQHFERAVEEGFAERRTVEDYAAQLGYSVRTLARATESAVGRTPKQVLDDRVLLEAKRLLVETDHTVAAVGRRLGFHDSATFGKFFLRRTTMTPTAFRYAHTKTAMSTTKL
ncbi:helix-turn-helix transcriptional regulator [Nocardia sp. FBN12]|uniref:helix-turn-helix transcriptional regulator n=1 Tax=Nocardia sp. FBN12 TaxID=3419766 RepID=UPI003CFFD504